MKQQAPFDVSGIETKIKNFEANTGYELIVTGTMSSDPYPGAAYRGGLLAGLLVAGLGFHFFEVHPHSLEILITGAAIALMITLLRVSGMYRYFVTPAEAMRETSEKAAELFSHFQSQNLGHQASVLLFFSMQERKIHLLVDSELKAKLSQEDLNEAVALMGQHFKAKNYAAGVAESVTTLEQKILAKVGKRAMQAENHVANKVFWFA